MLVPKSLMFNPTFVNGRYVSKTRRVNRTFSPNIFFMSEEYVKKYYSEMGVREWRRLVKDPYHRLEFDTTLFYIRKHLTKKGGLILDAGGGPGRYSIELGSLGYDVVLFDLSPEMLRIAENQVRKSDVRHRIKQIIQGSIDDLSVFKKETFDAVICLGGALCHIVDETRREKAIDELVRVAKKGSPIFVSAIGRLAVLVNQLVLFPEQVGIKKVFERVRDEGDYYGGYGFAPCHFYLPEELKGSFEKRGIEVLEMVGLEGLASGHQKETNRLARKYAEAWKVWWKTHLRTCAHPTSVGISEHFMIVCRK
jgi:SAM-dependent methyltransferase